MKRFAAGLLAGVFLIVHPGVLAAEMRATGDAVWDPTAGMTFQWQLQGKLNLGVEAEVYDVDMFDTKAGKVEELHALGRKVVCYISAGSYENWRPDAKKFPKSVRGKPLDGWPGERWLDVRQLEVLQPIMLKRLAKCAAKGFDGVEYDNIDGYTNETGFPLTKADQLAYVAWLAEAAHSAGLAAGLKNLPDLAEELEPDWDFAVNEQCFQYDECDEYEAFIAADKPVFQVEYEIGVDEFCAEAEAMGLTSMRKRYSLKAWRKACWEL